MSEGKRRTARRKAKAARPAPPISPPYKDSKEIVIFLPLPPTVLHPNSRPHWAEKARATKQARGASATVARSIRPDQPWTAATVHLTFWLPRKRDYDGLLSWCKAYLDGLQEGGILVADSNLKIGDIERFSGQKQTFVRCEVKLRIERAA